MNNNCSKQFQLIFKPIRTIHFNIFASRRGPTLITLEMDFHGINNTRADGGSQGQSSPPCLHIIRFCLIDLSACRLIAYPLNSHLNHCLVLFPPLSFGRPHFPNCMNWYPGAVAARAHHYISASTSPPIDSSESDSQIQSPILLNSSQSPPLSDPRFHGRSHPPPLPLQV